MFLWFIKQLLTFRKAFAGRNHPRQMAWGLALGLLLGLIPHGNLLTVALVMLVVCLNVNHAVVALTGVVASFFAMQLDPYSHQVGQFVLLHPDLSTSMGRLWQLPLVPWTDLNNTIVMGSFLIGTGLLLPTYLASYPFFRMIAPRPKPEDEPNGPQPRHAAQLEKTRVDPPHDVAPNDTRIKPQFAAAAFSTAEANKRELQVTRHPGEPQIHSEPIVFTPLPRPNETPVSADVDELPSVGMETQIDVIRLKDYRVDTSQPDAQTPAPEADNAQINQALNYLLRRLRNSQQEKAA